MCTRLADHATASLPCIPLLQRLHEEQLPAHRSTMERQQHACRPPGLPDVVGLLVGRGAGAPSRLGQDERHALRLVCTAVCRVLDGVKPATLNLKAAALPSGEEGRAALQVFLQKLGLPTALTIDGDANVDELQA